MSHEIIRRLGLFGGTFNPIHNGHLKAAERVVSRFPLDKILFVPSYLPPHKSSREVAPPEDRFRMVELAVGSFPRFQPSALEIEAPGPSYSIITLERVKRLYPQAEVFFLVGIDAFLEIKTWRDYERLLASCSFIVMSRPGFSLDQASGVLEAGWRCRLREGFPGSSDDRERSSGPWIFLFPFPALDISSTEIRRRLQRGESITGLVPPAVEEYIYQRRLYQG